MKAVGGDLVGAEATVRADAKDDSEHLVPGGGGTNPLRMLRPLRGTEPLDLGFELFRVQARVLVPIATLLYVPIQLVDLIARLTLGDNSETSVLTTSGVPAAALFAMRGHEPFVLALQSVALSLLGICSGAMTAALLDQKVLRFKRVLTGGLRRIWVSVVIVALSAVGYAIGSFFFFIGAFVFASMVFMTSVIAGAEDLGPLVAFKRGFRLTRANTGRAMGLFIGGGVLLLLTRLVLLAGPVALVAALGAPGPVINALSSASAIVLVVVQPLTATLASGAYVAFRVGSEGIDLQERIKAFSGPH